jgi:hypothetical protein
MRIIELSCTCVDAEPWTFDRGRGGYKTHAATKTLGLAEWPMFPALSSAAAPNIAAQRKPAALAEVRSRDKSGLRSSAETA